MVSFKNTKKLSLFSSGVFVILLFFLFQACGTKGTYNFTGATPNTAKTVKINRFKNYAEKKSNSTFEPKAASLFTQSLQDEILSLPSLNLANDTNYDLYYEGEIIEYSINPVSPTATQTAAQNRLTIAVQVRFTNNTKADADFEQRFSFFYDFPATTQLSAVKSEAHEVIFERITQDIFNASLATW